jgi:hypothetical protein
MGTGNDPGVLPGRTNRVLGTEGADAESGGNAPASDPRYGNEAAGEGACLAATLSNHEAVAGEADARRAARGNASLRFALTTGLRFRTHSHESHQSQKGDISNELTMGTFLTSFDIVDIKG